MRKILLKVYFKIIGTNQEKYTSSSSLNASDFSVFCESLRHDSKFESNLKIFKPTSEQITIVKRMLVDFFIQIKEDVNSQEKVNRIPQLVLGEVISYNIRHLSDNLFPQIVSLQYILDIVELFEARLEILEIDDEDYQPPLDFKNFIEFDSAQRIEFYTTYNAMLLKKYNHSESNQFILSNLEVLNASIAIYHFRNQTFSNAPLFFKRAAEFRYKLCFALLGVFFKTLY